MPSILSYAPGTLRACQEKVLLWVEANWDLYDVFVINAPVSAGKSWIALTIAKWQTSGTTAIITPTRQLQDQYSAEFPNCASLKGRDAYACSNKKSTSCGDWKDINGTYCTDCPYVAAKADAQEAAISIYNYYTYIFHRVFDFRGVLIVDEAHNVVKTISALSQLKVSQAEHAFTPDDVKDHGNLAAWMERQIAFLNKTLEFLESKKDKVAKDLRTLATVRRKIRDWDRVRSDLMHSYHDFYYSVEGSTVRGKQNQSIRVEPLKISNIPPKMWPRNSKVKKIVLMSATIDHQDALEMNFPNRKIGFIETESPIPPQRRPFVATATADMTWKLRKEGMPAIAAKIKQLAEKHHNEKGLVHCTYGMAVDLQPFLIDNPRFLWHTSATKKKVYEQFRTATEPVILIASGMAEGIDLAYDAGRWQAICTMPFPQWEDGWVKRKAATDVTWYNRTTVRTIQQQSGRICRTPDDTGVTYMLDSRFMAFFYNNIKEWSQWFKDAVVYDSSEGGK